MPRNTDHCVFNGRTRHMECRHCGATMAVAMPIDLRDMAKLCDAWVKKHRNCKAPVPTT